MNNYSKNESKSNEQKAYSYNMNDNIYNTDDLKKYSEIKFDIYMKESNSRKESNDKKELILKYLKYIGLNKFNLESMESIRIQVKEIIEHVNIDYCGIFNSHVNEIGTVDDTHMRLCVKENNIFKIYNFTLVRNLTSEGYWNKIQLYKDTKNKYYIFRTALKKKEIYSEPDDEYLYKSFEENLKHIILYFLLKYYYSHIKYKIVPEVYYFGLYIDCLTKEKSFITCMEAGEKTLENYFESISENYFEMRRTIYTIFRSLEMLNDFGLSFTHGDLKYNNILMTKKNKPMIIDFGKSRFKLDNLIFESINHTSAIYNNPYMNVTHDIMQLLCSLFIPKKPSLLITEQSTNIFDYKFDVYKIINFINNKNCYILEGNILQNIAKKKYGRFYIPYKNFYIKYKMFAGIDLNELMKLIPDINFTIKSSDLAKNLEITNIEDDKIFDKYNNM